MYFGVDYHPEQWVFFYFTIYVFQKVD